MYISCCSWSLSSTFCCFSLSYSLFNIYGVSRLRRSTDFLSGSPLRAGLLAFSAGCCLPEATGEVESWFLSFLVYALFSIFYIGAPIVPSLSNFFGRGLKPCRLFPASFLDKYGRVRSRFGWKTFPPTGDRLLVVLKFLLGNPSVIFSRLRLRK